jgi:hypothetical protein
MVPIFEQPASTVHNAFQYWVHIFLGLSFATLVVYAFIGYNGTMLNYVSL